MSKKTILIIIFSVLWIMVAQISKAAVINVTTTHDNVPGSLRAAITTANTNGEDDTIYLPAGTYILSGAAREDANTGGDLDINTGRKLTIIGKGKSQTYIHGNNIDRVLHILSGTVTISDLTIQNGHAPDGDCGCCREHNCDDGLSGGGIYNCGNLTLTHCDLKKNAAGNGGPGKNAGLGGSGGGVYNTGMLTLDNCIISNNNAGDGVEGDEIGGYGGGGGGILNQGTVTLNNCTISGNRSGIGGIGGTWDKAHSGDGGGISNYGKLTMSGCTVNNNNTGNVKVGMGNAGHGKGGGIYNHYRSDIMLTNCTISGNQAGSGYFSGNGGGLYNIGNSQLIGVTIANNTAGGSRCPSKVYGGGIYNIGTVRLSNSIVANNRVSFGHAPDCYGTFNWVSYSVIEDTKGCTLTGFQKANILGKDPVLGTLKNNGGLTYTHELLSGSPAIDAGDSFDLSEDQRGYTRPVDIPGIANVSDSADIGAYEFNTSYSISGAIDYGGSGMPGVTLTFSTNGGSTVTDSNGHYSHTVLYNWSGTVTPAKEGYIFNPSSRNYISVSTNLSNQDYTAASILPPYISLNHTQLYF